MINNNEEKQKKTVQAIIDDIDEMESIDIDGNYSQLKKRMGISGMRLWKTRFISYAAILTLPLLIASVTLGYFYYKMAVQPVQYAEVVASSGSVLRCELPDKSVVWLNSNSRLKYPMRFKGDTREVSLEGEGYFQVKSDKLHPFYVNTPNNMKVFVYGTHFDVNAYLDNPTIETVLEEGKVTVISPDNRMVSIAPGECLTYEKSTNKMRKREVNVYEHTAWVEGKLIFRDTPLDEVFTRLSRYFNVKIHFKNHSGHAYHYHATFTNETLPQILDYLSQSANLKWTIDKPVQQNDMTYPQKNVYVTLY